MTRERRDRGDGGIFYEAARKRWVALLDLGSDETGRRQRMKITGTTRKQVKDKLTEAQRAKAQGLNLAERATTFAQATDLLLTRGLASTLSQNTRVNYEKILRVHVLPVIGSKALIALRAPDIERVLDRMAAKDLAASTMRLALTLMRRVLKFAERRDLVQRNVANAVEAPAGPTKPRSGITPDEARRLLNAANSHRIGPMITLSLYLGLRPGEAAGLTWGAVDLDATPPVLHVTHSLQRIDEQMVLGPVKTATSNRTIALPPACVAALERQTELQALERHKKLGEWKNPLDLVFTTEVGTPLNPSNVRRGVQAVATRAGLGHFHPHLLRHAAASLMSAAGMRIEDIADTLGHRSIVVTAEIYRHPIAITRDRHLGAIEGLLSRSLPSNQTNN